MFKNTGCSIEKKFEQKYAIWLQLGKNFAKKSNAANWDFFNSEACWNP